MSSSVAIAKEREQLLKEYERAKENTKALESRLEAALELERQQQAAYKLVTTGLRPHDLAMVKGMTARQAYLTLERKYGGGNQSTTKSDAPLEFESVMIDPKSLRNVEDFLKLHAQTARRFQILEAGQQVYQRLSQKPPVQHA